jgi:hypothetical protein
VGKAPTGEDGLLVKREPEIGNEAAAEDDNLRTDICAQCVDPLLRVLGILPARCVCGDIGITTLIESHRLR